MLPSLRERSDLPAMIRRLLGERGITPGAMDALCRHRWPGNLRELRNALDYAASMAGEGIIDVGDLPPLAGASGSIAREQKADDAGLHELLCLHRWNVSEVARHLGVARMTVYRRMKRAGIVAPQDVAH